MGLASKLALTLSAKAGDNGIRVDPSAVLINAQLKARFYGADPVHVEELAQKLAREDQEVPCSVRKIKREDGTFDIELVAGEHRLLAARKINEDPDLRAIAEEHGNIHPKTKMFMLKVMVSSLELKEAMFLAIDENNLRAATSAIDDAHNQLILKEQFDLTDAEIGSRYKCGAAWISRMRLLTKLDDATKKLVHEGKIPVQKGMDMASLNDDQRAEVIENATTEDGEIDTSEITKGTREAANAKKDKEKQVGRNMTEFRKDLKEVIENEKSSEAEIDFAKDIMRYITGKVKIKGGIFNAALRYAEASEVEA